MPTHPSSPVPHPPADAALRVSILSAENSGLVAARSSTQSEMLARIGMFLTLVSATLVSVALVGQADRFGELFRLFAVAVLGFATIAGLLTQLRVANSAMEDLAYVLAMNRLRAAFADLAPGVQDDFMLSTHDDMLGVFTSYYPLGPRRRGSQILASSQVFIVAVNGALVGLLSAAIVIAASGSAALTVILGIVIAVVYVALSMLASARAFFGFWKSHTPRNPSL